MQNKLIQTYLDSQFIKTADEGNITNLKKSATEVQNGLIKKQANIIPYTLVAIDPLIPENDPVVVAVEKIIISKWPTFKNSVSKTKDKATVYIRVVILEALSQLSKEENFAAIIWNTGRDVITHYRKSNEATFLKEFLLNIGKTVEAGSRRYWEGNNSHRIENFKGADIQVSVPKAASISQEDMTNHLKAAAVHSGWQDQAGGGENPHTQSQNNWAWPKFFAERAAEGIAEVLNATLENQTKTLNSVVTMLQKEANNYLAQIQPYLETVSVSLSQGALAATKRSELLWWKQTLYSHSLNTSYRSLDPIASAIALAVDLSNMVVPICPISVDFLLKEALKDVHGDKVDTVEGIANWIDQATKMNTVEKELLQSLSNTAEGRKSLGSALADHLTNSSPTDIFAEIGISEKAEISLADLAVWIFHNLLAAKIASTKLPEYAKEMPKS